MKTYFKWKKLNKNDLKKIINLDPLLSNFIDINKPISIRITPDPYVSLVHSIISQQISSAALDSIWSRLILYIKKITPKQIANTSNEILRSAGLSESKIKYIKALTNAIIDKKIILKKIKHMNFDEAYKYLSWIPGIGMWTVEILLIFTFQNKNILSYGDYGIRNGLSIIYNRTKIDEKFVQKIKEKVSPYATILSFYCWKYSNESKKR